MPHEPGCDLLQGPTCLPIYHRGPNLQIGKLPSVIYFALSGEESLALDPYNQPVNFFSSHNIRVFSFTLPAHGPGFDNRRAMQIWSQEISQGRNIIEEFIDNCIHNISFLIQEGYVDPHHIGVSGLSRGAFAAAHLASRDPRINALLGFAPLTQLGVLDEFKEISHLPLVKHLSIMNLCLPLRDKKIRFYIGNHDTRVGTEQCFAFIKEAADLAYKHGHRSPPLELRISPSIGHKGHGTSPENFLEGAEWLKKVL